MSTVKTLAKEEVKLPIGHWETFTPNGRSEYLRRNRLFLQRYILENGIKTHVVLTEYDDSIIVK